MSDDSARDVRKVQDLYGLVIEKLTDHLRKGEPVNCGRDEEGNPIVEYKLNAQLVKAAIAVAERANVNVVVKAGSPLSIMVNRLDDVDGVTTSFPDEHDPVH